MAATTDDIVSVQQQGVVYLGLILQALRQGQVNWQPVPATATDPGTPGMIAYDTGFIYICVQTNVWRRVAISAF